jgi:hypothetical protein
VRLRLSEVDLLLIHWTWMVLLSIPLVAWLRRRDARLGLAAA